MTDKIYRIIDANLNRSREGLRVCEEIVRFVLNDDNLTRKIKAFRYKITRIAKSLPVDIKDLLASRDSDSDVARNMPGDNSPKAGYGDIFIANIARVKESLRVLEELTKLIDTKPCSCAQGRGKRGGPVRGEASNGASADFQNLRFEVYTLEKQAIERLQALCNTG